ncbi:MAG: hypothetical protein K8I82_07935, partial [Anaerolineae bacterium]|nr:hypothetical protein [Anaerolineae bacterium]
MADTLEKQSGWHSPPEDGNLPGLWKQPETPPAESLAEQPARPDPQLSPVPETAGDWYLPPSTIYVEKEPEVVSE